MAKYSSSALAKMGINIGDNGEVIILKANRERPDAVSDLDAAIRQQEHILNGYFRGYIIGSDKPGENIFITDIVEITDRLNNELNDWDAARGDRERIKAEINHLGISLALTINGFKRGAANQLILAAPITDSLGRVNPGMAAARLVAASERLASRLEEIGQIAPIIALRKQALLLEKDRIDNIFLRTDDAVKNLLDNKVFKDNFVKGTDLKTIDKILGQLLHYLDTINASPYRERAGKTRENIFEAKKEIQKGRFKSAKEILQKIK